VLLRDFARRGGAVARVRHHAADGLASRRVSLADGCIALLAEEVQP